MTELREFPESDPVDRCLAVAAVPFYSILIVVAILTLLVGCAPTALGLPAGQRVVPAPCLPDGVPPQDTWQMIGAKTKALMTDQDGAVFVLEARYDFGSFVADVTLTPFGPAFIDPAPDDPSVPTWVNTALMTPELRVRAVPSGPCRWQSVPPTLVPEPGVPGVKT